MNDQSEKKPDSLCAEYFDKNGNLVEGTFYLFIDKKTGAPLTGVLDPTPGARALIPHSVYKGVVEAFDQLGDHHKEICIKNAEAALDPKGEFSLSEEERPAYVQALQDVGLYRTPCSFAIIHDYACQKGIGRNTRVFDVNGPVLENQMTRPVITARLGITGLNEAGKFEAAWQRAEAQRIAAGAPPTRPGQTSTTAPQETSHL